MLQKIFRKNVVVPGGGHGNTPDSVVVKLPPPVVGKKFPTNMFTDAMVMYPLFLGIFFLLPVFIMAFVYFKQPLNVNWKTDQFDITQHSTYINKAIADNAETQWRDQRASTVSVQTPDCVSPQVARTMPAWRFYIIYKAFPWKVTRTTVGRINDTMGPRELKILGTVFDEAVLREIQDFEWRMQNWNADWGWTKICWTNNRRMNGEVLAAFPNCVPITSAIAYFFPGTKSQVPLDCATPPNYADAWPMDGWGSSPFMAPIADAVATMLTNPNAGWFLGRTAQPTKLFSPILRTQVTFGYPLDGFAFDPNKVDAADFQKQQDIVSEHVEKILDDMAKYNFQNMEVAWGGDLLLETEQARTFRNDRWAIALSVTVMVVAAWYHAHSFFIGLCVLGILALSYLCSLLLFRLITGSISISPLSILSLYVLIGLNTDAMFVFFAAFRHSGMMASHGRANILTLKQRLAWVYRKAGVSITVASAVVFIGFATNLMIPVPAFRQFAQFMCILIIVNWYLYATVFPCIVVFHHKHISGKRRNAQRVRELAAKQKRTAGKRNAQFVRYMQELELAAPPMVTARRKTTFQKTPTEANIGKDDMYAPTQNDFRRSRKKQMSEFVVHIPPEATMLNPGADALVLKAVHEAVGRYKPNTARPSSSGTNNPPPAASGQGAPPPLPPLPTPSAYSTLLSKIPGNPPPRPAPPAPLADPSLNASAGGGSGGIGQQPQSPVSDGTLGAFPPLQTVDLEAEGIVVGTESHRRLMNEVASILGVSTQAHDRRKLTQVTEIVVDKARGSYLQAISNGGPAGLPSPDNSMSQGISTPSYMKRRLSAVSSSNSPTGRMMGRGRPSLAHLTRDDTVEAEAAAAAARAMDAIPFWWRPVVRLRYRFEDSTFYRWYRKDIMKRPETDDEKRRRVARLRVKREGWTVMERFFYNRLSHFIARFAIPLLLFCMAAFITGSVVANYRLTANDERTQILLSNSNLERYNTWSNTLATTESPGDYYAPYYQSQAKFPKGCLNDSDPELRWRMYSEKDRCGICGGNDDCVGCDGVADTPSTAKRYDACDVCDGNGLSCMGCDNVRLDLGGLRRNKCGGCTVVDVGTCPLVSDCSGHGAFNQTTGECICRAPYTGPTCFQCGCYNGGTCKAGSISETWVCECPALWSGPTCQECRAECRPHGFCVPRDKLTNPTTEETAMGGRCECRGKWSGTFCTQCTCGDGQWCDDLGQCHPCIFDSCDVCNGLNECKNGAPFFVVTPETTVSINYYWGLPTVYSNYWVFFNGLKRQVDLDLTFDLSDARAQQHLLVACDAIAKQPRVLSQQSQCVMKMWYDWLVANGKTFPVTTDFAPTFWDFVQQRNQWENVAFSATNRADAKLKVIWIRAVFPTDIPLNYPYWAALIEHEHFQAYANAVNWDGPQTANKCFMTSPLWPQTFMHAVMLSCAFFSSIVAAVVTIILLFMLSCSILLTVMTALTIGAALAVQLLVFVIAGWSIGPVEAIAITVLIGMSASLTVHIVEGYIEFIHASQSHMMAKAVTRVDAMRGLMLRSGVPLSGSSLTVICASFFICFTQMRLLQRIGGIMIVNAVFTIFFTIFYSMSFLALFGPTAIVRTRKSFLIHFVIVAFVVGIGIIIIWAIRGSAPVRFPTGEPWFQ